MTLRTSELIERVRRRYGDAPVRGVPATDDDIAAAEAILGCAFPPSYRAFLRQVGGLSLPPHLGVVHDIVGLHGDGGDAPVAAPASDHSSAAWPMPLPRGGVVEHTLAARRSHRLDDHLVVVGMGAGFREWFCLDVRRTDEAGECPVRLYDASDRALDGEFYSDFGRMVEEVLGFVEQQLEVPLD